MAISGGPDIVEDGLVLHLDAAEPLCFRGEPTTNLMPYSNGIASRVAWPYGSYTHSVETTGEFAGWEKIIANTTGTISDYVMRLGDVLCTANTQYTATIEFYAPYGTVEFVIGGNQGGGSIRIGDTNKYYLTFTKNGTTGYMGWYIKTTSSTPANTAIPNGVIYYRRAQMEQKPYYTDFTIGTRGSTVATGGGLLDLTNNGNNGEINRTSVPSAAFYSGNNSGSFVFDGGNDYISVPYASAMAPTSQISYGVYAYSSNWNDITSSVRIMSKTENGGYQIAMNEPVYLGNGYVGGLIHVAGTYRAARILKSSLSSGWHYMQFTFDGRYYRMYLDGINVNTYDHGSTASISYAYNNHLAIGAEPDGTTGVTGAYFPGKIAQLTMHNRALSASEVQQNYNALKGRFGL